MGLVNIHTYVSSYKCTKIVAKINHHVITCTLCKVYKITSSPIAYVNNGVCEYAKIMHY